jgi:hypothetical protein
MSCGGYGNTEIMGRDTWDGLVRVWELAGRSGSRAVKLPANFEAPHAIPVNLRGGPAGDAIRIRNGKFSFKLGASAPGSFRLE